MEKENIFKKLKCFYEKLFKRIINIIINPKVELKTILDENPKQTTLVFGYALFLGAIPLLSCIVFSFFKVQESDKHFYFVRGLIEFIFTFISIYFVSWIIELLANNFNSEKNYLRQFN